MKTVATVSCVDDSDDLGVNPTIAEPMATQRDEMIDVMFLKFAEYGLRTQSRRQQRIFKTAVTISDASQASGLMIETASETRTTKHQNREKKK